MTEQTLFLVSDEDGMLRGIFADLTSADKFKTNHGFDSWTIEEDGAC